ncbi:hypothetical protein M404DRAFT_1008899 [Pisolithus tinctorius Marx 270]|uniref:Uncharacterized protein n=1 Tax=Pisolithus tinctorius Marx 270 TaxID=870435 RepID=A0A0C3NCD2_PISTI|nr:hypothetical protein M404DRAFT_1008899 [Pisolithus tinctorius Marx 270]
MPNHSCIRVMHDDTCKESGTTWITLVGKKITNCPAADAGLISVIGNMHGSYSVLEVK